MMLVFTLAPLTIYVGIAAQLFRRNIVASAEMELMERANALIMLCEAQEALDRLTNSTTSAATGIDAVTRASPGGWQEGAQYRSLQSIITSARVATSGFADVFNSDGRLLIHPREGLKDGFDPQVESANFQKHIRDRAVSLPVGSVETIRYDSIDPRDPARRPRARLAGFGYFKPYDWIVVVGCYEDELTAPYAAARRLFYLMILVTPFGIGAPVFFISRRMMKPVVRLTEAAAQIAHGEFRAAAPLGSRDEIGELTGQFNLMLDRLHEEQIHQLREGNKELERKVAERTSELEKRAEQLSTLAFDLTRAEIRERKRLAQFLHDDLQQLLVCTKLSVSNAKAGSQDETVRKCLDQAAEMLDQSIAASRSLTSEIAPPILHGGDLADALRWIARWMKEKHGLTVEVRVDEEANARYEVRALLFQVVRELLFNVVKHAGVERAEMRLTRRGPDELTIVVIDNGKGFEPGLVKHPEKTTGGFGLFSIHERLQWIGGRCEIASTPGAGATISLFAPAASEPPAATAAASASDFGCSVQTTEDPGQKSADKTKGGENPAL
jgi:signal transduction histidine kinase